MGTWVPPGLRPCSLPNWPPSSRRWGSVLCNRFKRLQAPKCTCLRCLAPTRKRTSRLKRLRSGNRYNTRECYLLREGGIFPVLCPGKTTRICVVSVTRPPSFLFSSFLFLVSISIFYKLFCCFLTFHTKTPACLISYLYVISVQNASEGI